MKLDKIIKIIFTVNIFKSVIINFSEFGIMGIKLPIFVEYGVVYKNKGRIVAHNLDFKMLIIKSKSKLEIKSGGILLLNGRDSVFNYNNRILIGEGAIMEIGNKFSSNIRSDFNCLKHVIFGNNVLLSANIMILDTDFHKIYNEEGKQVNENMDIIIGNNVWIGYNTTILKGTRIGNNIVIGACSLLKGDYLESNSIFAGNPAKLLKQAIYWEC